MNPIAFINAVAGGLGNLGQLIVEYHDLLTHMDGSEQSLNESRRCSA